MHASDVHMLFLSTWILLYTVVFITCTFQDWMLSSLVIRANDLFGLADDRKKADCIFTQILVLPKQLVTLSIEKLYFHVYRQLK